MNGCDEAEYRVTVVVNHTYRISATSEKEAENKALYDMQHGILAPAVWPVRFETTVIEPMPIEANKGIRELRK
jgi:hypothetical protein